MKIAFFSNYLNHHQLPLVNAFNAIDGIEFTFVATESVPEFRKNLGYRTYDSPFLLDTTTGEEQMSKARKLAVDADVAIFMANAMETFEIPRLKTGKLTFEVSERRFKKGFLNLLSPHLWKHQLMYWIFGRKAPLYLLCCSAFASRDYEMLGAFAGKCFKWAYFTEVAHLERTFRNEGKCRIMWCGRFIGWKHPELAIKVAGRLKSAGLDFEMDIFGQGPLEGTIRGLVDSLELEEHVRIRGGKDNEGILDEMRRHDIFLFTSDRNEGWGAVANEAMSNGCAIIGSDETGAVPFLVKDKENGLIFRSGDEDSLYEATCRLITDTSLRTRMAQNAYGTMSEEWSPRVAAERFVKLAENLMNGGDTPYADGPCSKA